MDDKDTYLHELEIEIYELSSKIDALRVHTLGEEDSNIDDEDIYLLEEKEEQVREKLEVLKSGEDNLWEEHKQDLDDTLEELREAIRNVFTIQTDKRAILLTLFRCEHGTTWHPQHDIERLKCVAYLAFLEN